MRSEEAFLEQAIYAGEQLPVMEAFYTLQGEGAHQGKAAYFIRLAGCDVGCHWCDVRESWQQEGHPVFTVEEIAEKAAANPARLAVITGGEPLMHNLAKLTALLHKYGFIINIETSGSSPLSGELDWICLSPKKFKNPLPEAYEKANELKIIVFNEHDFRWAEEEAAKVNPNCLLLLQPEWGRQEKMLPRIIEYVKQNPKWRVSLQTHKFMQIP